MSNLYVYFITGVSTGRRLLNVSVGRPTSVYAKQSSTRSLPLDNRLGLSC